MSEEENARNSFGGFLKDCRAEVGKISWPKRNELIESTWVVAAVVLLLSLFVFVCDQVLTKLLTLMTTAG